MRPSLLFLGSDSYSTLYSENDQPEVIMAVNFVGSFTSLSNPTILKLIFSYLFMFGFDLCILFSVFTLIYLSLHFKCCHCEALVYYYNHV